MHFLFPSYILMALVSVYQHTIHAGAEMKRSWKQKRLEQSLHCLFRNVLFFRMFSILWSKCAFHLLFCLQQKALWCKLPSQRNRVFSYHVHSQSAELYFLIKRFFVSFQGNLCEVKGGENGRKKSVVA